MRAGEVLGELLDTVNPTTGDDWAISEVSFDGFMNEAIFQLCLSLGLRGSSNSLVQTSIPIISYVTIMEGFQHVLGSGAGFIIFFFFRNRFGSIVQKNGPAFGERGEDH